MVSLIPERLNRLWEEWNIQIFMMLSLSLQIILIFFAPLRMRTNKVWLISLIWSTYLLADWSAAFAIGLISSTQTKLTNTNNTTQTDNNGNLSAFWAPFLLLHLGGPDTITAFSLEDNALWLRHFLGLIFQCLAAVYVFIQSLSSNQLLVPTMLLFVAGFIKYGERSRALYLASLDRFRKSTREIKRRVESDDYATYVEEHFPTGINNSSSHHGRVITEIPEAPMYSRYFSIRGNLDEVAVVQDAYHFFKTFKGVLADLVFKSFEVEESQAYFYQRTSEDALKVISVQFNMFYQVLYTKTVVVRSNMGYVFRFVSFCAVAVAFFLFYFVENDQYYNNVDVKITYTLLYGAMALEVVALTMLVFSDWTVASLMGDGERHNTPVISSSSWIGIILEKYLKLKSPNWPSMKESSKLLDRARRILFRRWSESVSFYNLIDHCLNESPKVKNNNNNNNNNNIVVLDFFHSVYVKLIDVLGLKEFRDKMKYVSTKPLSKELWEFIFQQLRNFPYDRETERRYVSTTRGAFVLQSEEWKNDCVELMKYVHDVDFDHSLLMWHIATELCYATEDKDLIVNTDDQQRREFSKMLSDYLLYLIIMQPAMMSSIAGIVQTRFGDTCEEAKEFFRKRRLGPGEKQEVACGRILGVNTDIEPERIKGDTDKSVLFYGSILAKTLDSKLKEQKWMVVSQVWVEMLAYAASQCGPRSHAQMLSSGGELVSYVWLLMVHFGMTGQFQMKPSRRITMEVY